MALTKVPSNLDSVTATTQSQGDNSTNVATTAYVDTGLNALIDSAPGNLNTLNELAAAMNDNASFFSTVLPLSGGTMTGALTLGDIIASGSDGLSLQTDEGTKRLFIKDNGDVKVGNLAVGSATTAPLHVAKASADVQAVFGDNNSSIDDPSIRIIGRDSGNSAIRYMFAGLDADANHGFIGYNAGAGSFVNALNFDTSGNVGIGTTSPSSILHLSGNSDTSDEDCMIIINDEDDSAGSQIPAIQFRGDNNNIGRIRANGSLGLILSGSSAQGDDLVVQAGKVGMGTTSPTARFDLGTDGVTRNSTYDVSTNAYISTSGGAANNTAASIPLTIGRDDAASTGDEIGLTYNFSSGNWSSTAGVFARVENASTAYTSLDLRTWGGGWSTGMTLNSSGHVDIPDQPGARLGIPSTQTITSSWSVVNFSDDDSTDGMYNKGLTLSNGDITVPTAGRYLIMARFRSEAAPFSAGSQFEISVNNAASGGSYVQRVRLYIDSSESPEYTHAPPLDSILDLVAGARFRIRAIAGGNNFNLSSSSNTVCHLSIIKLA